MNWNNLEQKFLYVFEKYNPKDKSSYEILKFYAEDLKIQDKQKYIDSILEKRAWILGTEICKISHSEALVQKVEIKFALIIDNWINERLNHSINLSREAKFPNLPKKYSYEFVEILFSIRNLGFPKQLLDIIQKFFTECNKNYLKKFFEGLFAILIDDFDERDIEKFFIYFSNNYHSFQYSNFSDFAYYFFLEFSNSYKIFSISNSFSDNLKSLALIFKANLESGINHYSMISFLLCDFIVEKNLNLNTPYYSNLINKQIEYLEKGSLENIIFFKFLKKFDFNFANFNFEDEIDAFFNSFFENISKFEDAQQTHRKAIAYHYLKSNDDYTELFFFYLSNINENHKNKKYLEKFIDVIDNLRTQLESLFWIKEYLNYDIIQGSVASQLNGGYLVKIDKDPFLQHIKSYTLEFNESGFIERNFHAFLPVVAIKESPELKNVCNEIRLQKISSLEKKFSFRISNINYSSSNKGAIITVVPDNERFRSDVYKFDLKSIFTTLELVLINKSYSILAIKNSFLSSDFKNLFITKKTDNDSEFIIDNNDFWCLLEKTRPKLYNVIFKENEINKGLFENITVAFKSKDIIEGKVLSRTNGGLFVDVLGLRAFLPGSQVDVKFVSDFDSYVGKTLQLIVLSVDIDYKSIIVSRRAVIEPIIEKQKENLRSKIQRNSILEGYVKNITSYGAFVDLGGIDGLINISDISWKRIDDPNEILIINQKVKVKILDFDESKLHISLGLKHLMPNPSKEFIDKKLHIGALVKGKVVSIVEYGVFVELTEGVEGLIHISELSWFRKHPSEVFKIGQYIETKVISINNEENKISLSVKYKGVDPWKNIDKKIKAGFICTGQIKNVADFGIFVELEYGIVGLIHNSDMQYVNFNSNLKVGFKEGDIIDVVVKHVNASQKRISLSYRLASEKFWNLIEDFSMQKKDIKGEVLSKKYGRYEILLENNILSYCYVKENNNTVYLSKGERGIFRIEKYNIYEKRINVSFIKRLRKRIL